jgi:hypothetical protein
MGMMNTLQFIMPIFLFLFYLAPFSSVYLVFNQMIHLLNLLSIANLHISIN